MNYFISFMLQFPVYYVLVNGLAALTGLSIWWCIPIAVVLDVMYCAGENIRRGE